MDYALRYRPFGNGGVIIQDDGNQKRNSNGGEKMDYWHGGDEDEDEDFGDDE